VTDNEFTVTMEAELWVHFIEKARAKMYGTYFDSFALKQTADQVYNDLTGAKTQLMEINGNHFELIDKAKNLGHVVALRPKNDKFVPMNLDYSVEVTLTG
jgi:hypothetical protein